MTARLGKQTLEKNWATFFAKVDAQDAVSERPKRPPLSSREDVQSTHGTEGLLDCFLDGPSEITLNSWCQEKSTKVQEWCYVQWFVARSPRSNQHLQWPGIYAKDVMIWRTYVWSEARTSYQTPSSLISSIETGCGMENSRGKISNILRPLASFCVCLLNFAHLLQLARPFEGLLLYQVRSETWLKAQNWLKRAVSPSLGWRMLKANPASDRKLPQDTSCSRDWNSFFQIFPRYTMAKYDQVTSTLDGSNSPGSSVKCKARSSVDQYCKSAEIVDSLHVCSFPLA